MRGSVYSKLQLQLQFQIYSFNLNLQFHNRFHPHIGEANQGRRRDIQIYRKEKKKEIFYKQNQLLQNKNYSMF